MGTKNKTKIIDQKEAIAIIDKYIGSLILSETARDILEEYI